MAQDPVLEKVIQAYKDGTLTIDQLIMATRESDLVAEKFNRAFSKLYLHSLGQEELRNVILSGVASDLPWTDYAIKDTSAMHGMNVLASINKGSVASKLGLFSKSERAHREETPSKAEDETQEQTPKKTPPF